jgi:hypothetical protein
MSKIKSCNRIVKAYEKNNIYRHSWVAPLTNSDQSRSLHLSSIYWSKKMKEIQIHPSPQPGQPDWCTCTYCREMPEGEKVCCKENSERCHSRIIEFFYHLVWINQKIYLLWQPKMRTKQNTVIWKMSKKSIYNQPKPYFFQKLFFYLYII